jgi:hypothetical protein
MTCDIGTAWPCLKQDHDMRYFASNKGMEFSNITGHGIVSNKGMEF